MNDILLELDAVTFSRRGMGKSLVFGENGSGTTERQVIFQDVSLRLKRGQRVGLLGANGVGKTTLLRVMAGILTPDRGSVVRRGEVSTLLDIGYGMDPNLTGKENAYSRGILAGLSRSEANRHLVWIKEFSELGSKFDMPIRTYSNGMLSRLAFSIDMSLPKEILLVDEGFATADQTFQKKARSQVDKAIHESGLVVLATHSYELLRQICDSALVLAAGKIAFNGNLDEAIDYHESSGRSSDV